MKSKGTRKAKTILKKNEVGGLILSDFKTYCNQDSLVLAKGSIQISIEKTESHSMVNGFLKGAKASQWRRYSFFNKWY